MGANVNIYLPTDAYIRFSREENKSRLIQQLLEEYWAKTDAEDKS